MTPAPLFDNRYALLDLLGEGGMGTVWHARDQLSGAAVALKRIRFHARHIIHGSTSNTTDTALALGAAAPSLYRQRAGFRLCPRG